MRDGIAVDAILWRLRSVRRLFLWDWLLRRYSGDRTRPGDVDVESLENMEDRSTIAK